MIEALFYKKGEHNTVRCFLCGHSCTIKEGKRGICCVRENRGGILYSLNSDRLISSASDPVEKKPLYHFLPGTQAFSVAAAGCNFKCAFCQNSSISQVSCKEAVQGEMVSFERIVDAAVSTNARSIAYTYSEPTVFYEMVKGTSLPAKARGLKNVIVSNGFMSDEAARDMLGFVDGANIDLKFFKDESYRKQTGGNLSKVKSSIEIFAKASSFWLEITTLVIPGLNDSEEELIAMAEWIASLDAGIPWHLSRFFPQYNMQEKRATPENTLEKAYEIGKKAGLEFVYLGNIRRPSMEHTYCPGCGKAVIRRSGYLIEEFHVSSGFCKYCSSEIPGIWE